MPRRFELSQQIITLSGLLEIPDWLTPHSACQFASMAGTGMAIEPMDYRLSLKNMPPKAYPVFLGELTILPRI
jgi:hypothetical protein